MTANRIQPTGPETTTTSAATKTVERAESGLRSTARRAVVVLMTAVGPALKTASRRRGMGRILIILATLVAVLFGGTGAANAQVNTNAGGVGVAYSRCYQAPGGTTVLLSASVFQETNGQLVAARFHLYDNNGWHSGAWKTSTGTTWSSDGSVRFSEYFYNASGTPYWGYVEYGWLRGSTWVTGAEYVRTGCA